MSSCTCLSVGEIIRSFPFLSTWRGDGDSSWCQESEGKEDLNLERSELLGVLSSSARKKTSTQRDKEPQRRGSEAEKAGTTGISLSPSSISETKSG